MSTVIDVSRVGFSYHSKQAIKDVSFSIEQGQYYVLLGINGAGKTTLFSILSQFLTPSSGTVKYYHKQQQRRDREALGLMGFVFQQTTLDLDLTVAENLYYHASLHGIGRREAKLKIKQELERLQMLERLNDKVRTLNGGHKRRVEIARALLHNPKILLLDEPTVGLDLATREYLNDYLRSLCEREGTATLCTTHMLDDIMETDNVLLLKDGEIKLQGACGNLLKDYDALDIRSLLANEMGLKQ